MNLRNDNVSYLVSATIVFIIILGIISVSSGQQQVVVNPDFEYGLLGWNVSVVKSFRESLYSYTYPRIEPTPTCTDYIPSYDGYCILFDAIFSEGYIWQTFYIPNGKAELEIKYGIEDPLLPDIGIYIELIELATGKIERYSLEQHKKVNVWRLSISHLSGKNVELRFGVDGVDCYSSCEAYVDYIRIVVYPTPTTTQTVFAVTTTTLTHVETHTYTTTRTTVTTGITEIDTYTHTLTVTKEITETMILTTTIRLTKAMAQLGDFVISVKELQYISIIGLIVAAVSFFLLAYYSLRIRMPSPVALGFALLYSLFGGILAWRITPLFLTMASSISVIAVEFVDYLLMIVFMLMFAIPSFSIILYYLRKKKEY